MSIKIKNVIFDFGGVIMDWSPYYVYDEYFGSHEKAVDFIQNICTPKWNATMDAGVTFKEATESLAKIHPEFEKEILMYRTHWHKMLKGPIESGVELLKDIHQSGRFELYGLTNWSYETFPYTREKYPLFNMFKHIVVSGEVKLIKPDPKIFEYLLDTYKLNPDECFFIDDNLDNIKTADRFGIYAFHLTHHESNIKVIRALLDV